MSVERYLSATSGKRLLSNGTLRISPRSGNGFKGRLYVPLMACSPTSAGQWGIRGVTPAQTLNVVAQIIRISSAKYGGLAM
ncbi:MAG: hypothetical protein ACI9ZM_001978 [Paracoccaceae bacterium]|jgi:hypothetical protein